MNAALRELLSGAGSRREAAHFVSCLLGCFSQNRKRGRFSGASATLQADDLILTREDLFDGCALVVIQTELLPLGGGINDLLCPFSADDRRLLPLSVDYPFEVRPLHLQHALCSRFSLTLLPDDPDKLTALLPLL